MRPLKLFISYAHEDDARREELCKHLTQMKREGLIDPWHDRDITGGKAWAGEIDANLEAADLVLLLISVDFLNSDYCIDVELKRALERHAERQARVVPIILRRCDWQSASFAKLHALPKDGEPLERWPTADTFFTEVARELRRIVGELQSRIEKPKASGDETAPKLPKHLSRLRWIWAMAILLLLGFAAWTLYIKPQLLIMGCDRLYRDPRPEKNAQAMACYAKALARNPKSAGLHFRLGVLSSQRMDWNTAEFHFDRAIELASYPPPQQYYESLAYLYMRQQIYDRAIEIYGGTIKGYALAALEVAKAHWALNQLAKAAEKQRLAIIWLDDQDFADQSYNRDSWYFEAEDGKHGIRLTSMEDKRCYARLALTASLALNGQEADAAQAMLQTGCPDDAADMKDVVADDLQRYAETVPDLRERSRAFRQRYLANP